MEFERNNIKYINVTNEIKNMESELGDFLDHLDGERKYFNLTLNRLLRCELLLIADYQESIIGVAGLEKKYGVTRSFIILKSEYHGKGIGRDFAKFRSQEAKNLNYNIIMSAIDENNKASLKMNFAIGYKKGGKRGNLIYIFKPLNKKGFAIYYFIKFLFPFFKVVDKIRR
jgi:RimJ/RimL family protein N-acetyltransferase